MSNYRNNRKLAAILALKQLLLDCGIQKIFYLKNKHVYFGRDIFLHVLIQTVPWFFMHHLVSISRKQELVCFLIDYISHHNIDCFKRKLFIKHDEFQHARWLRTICQCADQMLHCTVLLICYQIVKQ